MTTWHDIARENLVAAKSLSMDARFRSAVSRAYYAAYAGICGELQGKASFVEGRDGPSHEVLPRLVTTYLSKASVRDRRRVATSARRLYRLRIMADYRPFERVGAEEARSAIRDSSFVMRVIDDAEN